MAGEPKEEEGGGKLVEGLTSTGLLALADDLLARGVAKFTVGPVSVEFSPTAVAAIQAAKRDERDRAREQRVLEEAGGLAAKRKADADARADADLRRVVGSA